LIGRIARTSSKRSSSVGDVRFLPHVTVREISVGRFFSIFFPDPFRGFLRRCARVFGSKLFFYSPFSITTREIVTGVRGGASWCTRRVHVALSSRRAVTVLSTTVINIRRAFVGRQLSADSAFDLCRFLCPAPV